MAIEPQYIIGFGALTVATAWVPLALRNVPLSMPMLAIPIGILIALALRSGSLVPAYSEAGEALTEFVVIIALMGAGLKIDRRFFWRRWASTWRLLGIAMPLTIAGMALMGWWLLAFPLGTAVLLAAVLAPTDPVLASEVQVGPPGEGQENEVRFALTSEAGLNDGLAFPFVWLGLMLLVPGWSDSSANVAWFVVVQICMVVGGGAIGAGIAWALFRFNMVLPEHFRLARSGDGLASLGLCLLVYGISELVHVYGFLAVFAAAVTLRNLMRTHDYAHELHDFAEQIERLAMVVVMVLFGAALAGNLLASITIWDVVFTVVALLLIRPISVLLGFMGSREPMAVRSALGYFGIRGIGSFYYLFFALNQTSAVPAAERLQAVVALVTLASVVLYGLTAGGIMARLELQRQRSLAPEGDLLKPPEAPRQA